MAFFAIRKGVITNADSIVWFITKTCGISELAALGILNSAFGTGLSAYEGTQAAIKGLCKEMGSCG